MKGAFTLGSLPECPVSSTGLADGKGCSLRTSLSNASFLARPVVSQALSSSEQPWDAVLVSASQMRHLGSKRRHQGAALPRWDKTAPSLLPLKGDDEFWGLPQWLGGEEPACDAGGAGLSSESPNHLESSPPLQEGPGPTTAKPSAPGFCLPSRPAPQAERGSQRVSWMLGTCPESFGSLRKKKKKDIYYQRLFVLGFSVLKRQSKFSLQLKGLQNRKSEGRGVGLKQISPSITQEARGAP